MRKLKELRPGEAFKFAGLNWVKLDDLEEGWIAKWSKSGRLIRF